MSLLKKKTKIWGLKRKNETTGEKAELAKEKKPREKEKRLKEEKKPKKEIETRRKRKLIRKTSLSSFLRLLRTFWTAY